MLTRQYCSRDLTMSPAVSSAASGGSSTSIGNQAKVDRQERKTDLLWRVNYTNTLRDIPFDGKCIAYPFEPGRFAEYRPTSMDLTRKFDLLTEPDLGVRIDLVTAAAGGYIAGANSILAPEDERLLEDEPSGGGIDKNGLAAKKKRVPWLRRTQYLGADLQRYGTQTSVNEVRVGRRFLTGDNEDIQLYKDPEAQVQAIQRTFELAQQPIPSVHHSRPGVTPVEVLPVFPDFDMWQYPAAQVLFDSDPAPSSSIKSDINDVDRLSQAMIRGLQDDAGEQFVAYFLPSESTLRKRKRDIEEEVEFNPSDEYDYDMIREYNWNVRTPAERTSGNRSDVGFAFIIHGDRVVYDELDTRVRLSKRKKPSAANVRSRLIVKFRPFSDQELATQKSRLSILENGEAFEFDAPGDEDEGEQQTSTADPTDAHDSPAESTGSTTSDSD